MRSFSFMKRFNKKAYESNSHWIFHRQCNNQESIIMAILKKSFCTKREINISGYRLPNMFLHATAENVFKWEPFRINCWLFHLKGLRADDILVWDFAVETTHTLNVPANLGWQRGWNTPQLLQQTPGQQKGKGCVLGALFLSRWRKELQAVLELWSHCGAASEPSAPPVGPPCKAQASETASLL